jgi:hypothetical protein
MKTILLIIVVCFSVPINPLFAAGPAFVFRVPETVTIGAPSRVTLLFDTQGESINALSGTVRVTGPAYIRRTSTSSSIIPLWVSIPVHSSTSVVYEGIIPGGFDGVYNVSNQTLEPGTLFSFDIVAQSSEPITITSSGVVYQNDGQGTSIIVPEHTISMSGVKDDVRALGFMYGWVLNPIFACGIILLLWFLRNFFKKRHL